jgi:GH15 family glucan-1,4-alpha-glucosidase
MKLEDHGFIGDAHTGALVDLTGAIDWLCLPRFDSGACFAALLGSEKHGHWRIRPSDERGTSRQAYRGDTLILQTDFTTESGRVRIIDFMPFESHAQGVVRIVQGLQGSVDMEMELIIRFDYGRTVPWVQKPDGALLAVAGPDALVLRSDVEFHGEGLSSVAEFRVSQGERKCFALTYYPAQEDLPPPFDLEKALETTEAQWKKWASQCTYQGKYRDAVVRSLLTLKALTYQPTGGIMAALTTSLPEKIGGTRNWDYRYCWLRDATFTLFSLMKSGYTGEAAAWSNWLLRAVAGDVSQLKIMYGAAGERRLPEFELDLPGYENSRPVRVGNAASEQFQLDIYGEVMGAMRLARSLKIEMDPASWPLQRHLAEFVVGHWSEPDDGIWEIRGPRRHFTHSKVMAWLAMDCAVRAVEDFKLEGDVEKWRKARQLIHDDVCEHGFNAKRGAFTQYYGGDQLDAALLMTPLVGFLPADDPRVRGTIELIEQELMVDGFVQRYHPDDSADVDGLPPGEGAFLPCSFWMVNCLSLLGRHEDAEALFDRLLGIRNGLGLLSEEYDPHAKRLIGNFPQAFSHISLINTAHYLLAKGGGAEDRAHAFDQP